MKSKLVLIFLCTPLIWGCTSTLAGLRGNQDHHLFEEMKTEIADLKHELHGTEVELKLLEEKFESRETETVSPKGDVAALQRKIALLEKTIDKMGAELRSLMTYANQTTTSLSQYRDQIQEIDRKLGEVGKLRSTLSQISKNHSVSEDTPSESSKNYRVKSGDSLEKIARKFHVSIETLKRENHLSTDKIVVGQELIISSADP
ncbi:MAG TPA: LysM peptidoglycan-binding domain-containing protein [Rhabdochlamydiaceae bacterium]|nr:LysM peptidoglycan-binding domain-containing protein [Rhabdochlamydiaceae bacterium]